MGLLDPLIRCKEIISSYMVSFCEPMVRLDKYIRLLFSCDLVGMQRDADIASHHTYRLFNIHSN